MRHAYNGPMMRHAYNSSKTPAELKTIFLALNSKDKKDKNNCYNIVLDIFISLAQKYSPMKSNTIFETQIFFWMLMLSELITSFQV